MCVCVCTGVVVVIGRCTHICLALECGGVCLLY